MPDEEIPLIPKVPDSLREAAQLGKLVPFVGAGASTLAKCPGWGELADGALESLRRQGLFSPAQIDQLTQVNPRVKLSIATVCQEDGTGSVNFDHLLHRDGWSTDEMGLRVYGALSAIARTFVTTNYDRWLDQTFPLPDTLESTAERSMRTSEVLPTDRKVFYKPMDFTAANLELRDTVFHLHGSVVDPDKQLIVTTHDYLRHYANDRGGPESPLLTFLDFLFRHRRVLFVGYGLEEMEILEYVIQKARRAEGSRQVAGSAGTGRTEESLAPQHFILQGFFSHERELMRLMARYYGTCGVQLLAYSRDEKNWGQLADVLEFFARDLPRATGGAEVLRDLNDMERLLND